MELGDSRRLLRRAAGWARGSLGPPTDPCNAIPLSLAVITLVQAARAYPLEYLFVPDREIWAAQVFAWLGIVASAVVAFALLRVATGLFVRWRARSAPSETARGAASPRVPFTGAAERFEIFLAGRAAPFAVALVAAAAMLYAWGGFEVPPVIHDESAYLLQARLYAQGRWKGPALPLPKFFDQMYVFTTPFHAAKYPPGYPLALVPGILAGVPLLAPLVLAGATAGLLFALGRKISNVWTGLLAAMLWITTPWIVSTPPPYMSQVLTQMLWLLGWWSLLRWVEAGRFRHLAALAAATGWSAITRPLTAAAFALPVAFVVLRAAWRRRAWAQLAAAAAVGALIVGLLPLWNYEVTGNVRTSPLVLNVRATTPYDQLGIGRAVAAPTHELPPDLRKETRFIGQFSKHHDWRDLPRIADQRVSLLMIDALGRWRVVLIPLAIAGALFAPPAALFAAGTCLLDLVLYLLFPHPAQFTMYYMEVQTVVAFLAAAGLWRTAVFVLEAGRLRPDTGWTSTPARRSVGFLLAALLLGPGIVDLQLYADHMDANHAPKRRFLQILADVPQKPAIIFVRYGPSHSPFLSFIENGADFPKQDVWVAYDRGPENSELLAFAPERRAYLFDEESNRLTAVGRPRRAGKIGANP